MPPLEFTMSPLEILAAVGLAISVFVAVYIAVNMTKTGNPMIAAALSAGFGTYSAVTIYQEGLMPVWVNHTTNMWGVQVWWDLLFAVGIGLFLIAPRAKSAGMNVPLWTVFVVATASIGLLAMCARLFWLEQAAGDTAAKETNAPKTAATKAAS